MKTQEEDILITKVLSGEATESEIAALSAWRNSHPAHEEQFRQSQLIWTRSQQNDIVIDTEQAWLKVQQNISQSRSKEKTMSWYVKIAAAILVISAASWYGFLNVYNPTISIQTAANEQKEIVLPDGSHVWLNELSRIEYTKKFRGKERNIALMGEAFFDVVKNPDQPFVITSDQAITEVLGTSFNLKVPKGTITASLNVVTGKVRFTSTDNTSEVIVVAGEKATINEVGDASKSAFSDINDLAWKSDKLVFNDEELKNVFARLETHFKVKITVENPAILNCHFTGSFDKPKLDNVLDIISKALQLNCTRKGKTVTIKGKGCTL